MVNALTKILKLTTTVSTFSDQPNFTKFSHNNHKLIPNTLPLTKTGYDKIRIFYTLNKQPHVRNSNTTRSKLWPRLATMFDPPWMATPHTNDTTPQILTSYETNRTIPNATISKRSFHFVHVCWCYVWEGFRKTIMTLDTTPNWSFAPKTHFRYRILVTIIILTYMFTDMFIDNSVFIYN